MYNKLKIKLASVPTDSWKCQVALVAATALGTAAGAHLADIIFRK